MARRTPRPARPQAPEDCPCGLPAPYAECCGRYHAGQAAPTAEALMRSRFSAFAVHDEPYLLRTWHPDHRPAGVDFDPGMCWTRLEVLDTKDGSAFHTTGEVTFRAHYTEGGGEGSLYERSRFVRYEGAWVYLDAVFTE
ncbi:YchJ family metal-binding protein [Streptomyces sp. BPTC-684]|uniref:YchJ family protein n=1 Tax=Streptomyces sp. BPTC-684 TaxID=3043734 RepID=UPI0024B2535D|nr:YchJ family metal-binding protein [Streptomyces sp. BPTC-684]WHM35595.1 YchJ family metal-binding protein [Streptomyces sp. BPTC-684]